MIPGSFDRDKELRNWLSKGIAKYCSRTNTTRHAVAGLLGESLDWEITKSMLDAWTAESKAQNRIPALIIPAACVLFGDYEGLRILAAPAKCKVLETDEAIYAEIALLEAESKKTNDMISRLKKRAEQMQR